MTRTAPARRLVAAWAGVAAAFYGVFIARTSFSYEGSTGFTLFDDAMISMRYARNLAEGHGLVWNAGDLPVEGYTNPLWTLWMALIHAAGASDLTAPLVVAISGGVVLFVTAWASRHVALSLWSSARVADAAGVLTLFSYGLVFWTLRGLEPGILACFGTLAMLAVLRLADAPSTRYSTLLGVVLAAAVLTRRDGALLAMAICGALVLWPLPRRMTILRTAVVATVLALTAQTSFSWWYYGDPLPNTYYLKMSGVPLIERMTRGAGAAAILFVRTMIVPAALAAIAMVSATRAQRPRVMLLASIVLSQLGYSVYVGGDAWEYMGYANRYISVALPLLCVLAAGGAAAVARRGPAAALHAIAGVLVLAALRPAAEAVLHAAGRGVSRGESAYLTAPRVFVSAMIVTSVLLIAAALLTWRRAGHGRIQERAAFAVLVMLAWGATDAVSVSDWIVNNGSAVPNDSRRGISGLLIRDLTPPETVIAVTGAGSVPYFARRHSIDILGKSDRYIARLPGRGPFYPGHNKWDLDYSIRALRPDLVSGLPRSPGEVRYLMREGYEPWHGTYFARTATMGDRRELRDRLEQLFPEAPPHPEAR